jgi:hypothetical protein
MASCPRPRRVPTDHDSNPGPDAGLNIVRPSGIIIGGDAVPVAWRARGELTPPLLSLRDRRHRVPGRAHGRGHRAPDLGSFQRPSGRRYFSVRLYRRWRAGRPGEADNEQGDVWGIMYGRSGLDGCDGARHARSVTVSGQPGLLSVATDPEGSSRKWVQLIWPATLKHSDGVFGLFGWLSPRAVLAMAESMPVVGAPPVADAGC